MFTLLAFLIIGSTILIYSKLYFFFRAKIVYKDFVKKFFFFSSLLFLFFCITFKKEILNYYSLNSIISLVIIYFLSFFSFCLTIGLKSISSPTEEIFKIINSKKVNINYLIKKSPAIAGDFLIFKTEPTMGIEPMTSPFAYTSSFCIQEG